MSPQEAKLENVEEQNVLGPIAEQAPVQTTQEESTKEKDKDIPKISDDQ